MKTKRALQKEVRDLLERGIKQGLPLGKLSREICLLFPSHYKRRRKPSIYSKRRALILAIANGCTDHLSIAKKCVASKEMRQLAWSVHRPVVDFANPRIVRRTIRASRVDGR